MNKTNLSLAVLLVGTAIVAGSFGACSKSNDTTSPTGTAGTTGNKDAGNNPAENPDGTCVAGAYKRDGACGCQDMMPTVCAVGCTDTTTDDSNCGTCGTTCMATATCNAGKCGSVPTVVVPAITGCTALTLAVASNTLYYADQGHGTITKLGTATPIATGEMAPTWLAAQGTSLFWYDMGNKTIRRSVNGGAPTTVYTNASTTDAVGGFLATPDGASVYVAVGTNIVKVAADGSTTGTPPVIVQELHGGLPRAMALNGATTLVFPTQLNGDVDAANITTTPSGCGMENDAGVVDMTTCTRLARSQGELLDTVMFVVGGTAYWVDGQNLKSESLTSTTGTFNTVSMSVNGTITAAAASTNAIYFTEDGLVEKTALAANSTSVQLARGQMAPTSIVLDSTKVYWATSDCTIGSTAQ